QLACPHRRPGRRGPQRGHVPAGARRRGNRPGQRRVSEGSGPAGASIGPVDAWQRRHSVLGFPVAVVYKFIDDFGRYMCALLTYYAFLSLFPALMLLSTALGIVLQDHPDWSQRILDSAVSEFPIVGDQLRDTGTLGGSTTGLVVGGVGALYGALGVGQALQY